MSVVSNFEVLLVTGRVLCVYSADSLSNALSKLCNDKFWVVEFDGCLVGLLACNVVLVREIVEGDA